MKLSIIVPVYNEKRTILTVLKRVESAPYDKEIVVIDDCSTDGTREVLREIDETRQNWPFLRDRRIDFYTPLTARFLEASPD